MRAAFFDVRHFEEFLVQLGIARNILSDRLGKLVAHGVLVRRRFPGDGRRIEYRLTQKGIDLLPALIALKQWGEKYGDGEQPDPVLVDGRDGRPIEPIRLRAHDGREVGFEDLHWCRPDEVGRPAMQEQRA